MKDTEFNALISLLEDEDTRVTGEIEKHLLAIGEEIVPRLEEAWEKESTTKIQDKITAIIQRIQVQTTADELAEWKNSGCNDLLMGWFIVSKFQYPNLEYLRFRNQINRIVNMVWLEMYSGTNYADRILAINRILFDIDQYKSNRSSPHELDNYFLNTFMERKKGNPFSLGILYLIICKELDLPVEGLILPNYFTLHYTDKRNNFYIDAYNKGAFFTKKDLDEYIRESNLPHKPEYFEPVSNKKAIYCLIEALIEIYKAKEMPTKLPALKALLKIVEK
jgi:regulator of sirC expression with transglutaminase-like and TPR domain